MVCLEQVLACLWSPDGSRIASCSEDKTLRIWNPSSGQCVTTMSGHNGRVSVASD
jgi:WD40 repeat protein